MSISTSTSSVLDNLLETSAASNDDRARSTNEQVLGRDDFLKLLTTQLSNQDPLNPMDGQEFAAQLAQFSSVEQLLNIKDSIEGLMEANSQLASSMNSGVAAGLIGKTIEAPGDTTYLEQGETRDVHFELDADAAQATITIRNEAGTTVRTLSPGALDEGTQRIEWDGLDENGNAAPSGFYSYSVDARDADGNAIEVDTFMSGRVDRVTFERDGIRLWVGDTPVGMQDVVSVTDDE